ncbi:hypothetical protein QOZ80_4BG0344880 [Eleusine coracana subsp. coracana]|nr:hypothetical protein QOZ80_4BG0344750 [Eleusine coracana subsp. coracana]KAK3142307.1 hypothetical protein QOZ80_4BG0344880 [Eleusine coracana subsp. coracana]
MTVLLSFQLLITTSLCQTSQVSDRDLAALIKVREHFGNPNLFPGWRLGTTCISWWPAACNEQGRVTKLFLDNLLGIKELLSVNTTLPPAISELEMLETLSIMSIPDLHGPIPESYGNLPHLSLFNIIGTNVSGSIPASLSLTNLTSVSLSKNKLTGPIPRSLRKLPYLSYFDASYNDLIGTIPPGLVRSTPDSPAALQLDGNRLSGTIPRSYRFERNSMEFRVANNRLTGDASFLFGRHKTVSGTIDLSGNNFRFNLTGVEMPMHLGFLNLSHNRIYGGVPVSLRESRVSVLDLSYNELCGEIPTGGHMVQFKAAAYEHNKCLCGTPLPPCANGR